MEAVGHKPKQKACVSEARRRSRVYTLSRELTASALVSRQEPWSNTKRISIQDTATQQSQAAKNLCVPVSLEAQHM